MSCLIVGKRYFPEAWLEPGQDMLFVREKDNKFDPNAIAVYTIDGYQLGYLEKDLVIDLIPLLDDETKLVTLDAEYDGVTNKYDYKIKLKIKEIDLQ